MATLTLPEGTTEIGIVNHQPKSWGDLLMHPADILHDLRVAVFPSMNDVEERKEKVWQAEYDSLTPDQQELINIAYADICAAFTEDFISPDQLLQDGDNPFEMESPAKRDLPALSLTVGDLTYHVYDRYSDAPGRGWRERLEIGGWDRAKLVIESDGAPILTLENSVIAERFRFEANHQVGFGPRRPNLAAYEG